MYPILINSCITFIINVFITNNILYLALALLLENVVYRARVSSKLETIAHNISNET